MVDEKRKAFSLFEVNGSGFVRTSNLKNVLAYLGVDTDDDRCVQVSILGISFVQKVCGHIFQF
jgi:Ca2+-binding EF-hand superfamily protein